MGSSGNRVDRAGDTFQRLMVHAIVGAFVALYSLAMVYPATAQEYIPRGQPVPQGIRYVNATATGANTSASAMWTNATGNTTYHKVPVHVSAGTLGKLAKGALKRGLPMVGWGMAFRGIVDGAGWAIDELGKQVTTAPGEPQQELGETAYCLQMAPSGEYRCSSVPGQLAQFAHHSMNSWTGTYYVYSQPCTVGGISFGQQSYACFRPSAGVSVNFAVVEETRTRPGTTWPSNYFNDNSWSPPVPVSDADLGNLLKQNPQIVNAILIDPDTGAPIRTQELTDAMNNLRRSLEAANGLEPGDDMLPSDDYSQTQPSEMELPEFCAWADVVCDFIDWFKADDSDFKDLPEHEIQIDPDSWSSGIGGGTCPAPLVETWTFMDTPARFEFDYGPMCQFAETLRPFLITCALICAAFIMAGLRSAGGKT